MTFDFWGMGPDDADMPWDEEGDLDMGRGIPPKEDATWRSSEHAPKKEQPVEPDSGDATASHEPSVESAPADGRLTIWQTIMNGTHDQRCRLKEVHVHDVLHALGLNPNALWPPEGDLHDEG